MFKFIISILGMYYKYHKVSYTIFIDLFVEDFDQKVSVNLDPPEVTMLPRLSALLLPSLLLSSVLCLEEESCSKDGGKEDCGAKKENKFRYNNN